MMMDTYKIRKLKNEYVFIHDYIEQNMSLLNDLTAILKDNKNKLSADDCEEVEDIIANLQENMAKITEHGDRAISIIQGILLISRGKDNVFIPTDIRKIVKEFVWLSYHAMRAKDKGFNVSIHEQYQDGMPLVEVIPQDLSRAVLNLMNNACYTVWKKAQTAGDGYKPQISVSVGFDGSLVKITFADNGEGMNDEVKQRLFENFFTTKPIGQGTGLGMSITRDIIENKHGGKLTFDSTEGEGTTFILTIPVKR